MILGRGNQYPEGYIPFSRYAGQSLNTIPSSILAPDGSFCWWMKPNNHLTDACLKWLDNYSTLTRNLPIMKRLLTVRSEWSKK